MQILKVSVARANIYRLIDETAESLSQLLFQENAVVPF